MDKKSILCNDHSLVPYNYKIFVDRFDSCINANNRELKHYPDFLKET